MKRIEIICFLIILPPWETLNEYWETGHFATKTPIEGGAVAMVSPFSNLTSNSETVTSCQDNLQVYNK